MEYFKHCYIKFRFRFLGTENFAKNKKGRLDELIMRCDTSRNDGWSKCSRGRKVYDRHVQREVLRRYRYIQLVQIEFSKPFIVFVIPIQV